MKTQKKQAPGRKSNRSTRQSIKKLEDIPNVGRSIAANFRQLGITAPTELAGRDPYQMYEDICRLSRAKHDPCLLDVFIAAVHYMEGAPKKPWWHYTTQRKRELARRSEEAV